MDVFVGVGVTVAVGAGVVVLTGVGVAVAEGVSVSVSIGFCVPSIPALQSSIMSWDAASTILTRISG